MAAGADDIRLTFAAAGGDLSAILTIWRKRAANLRGILRFCGEIGGFEANNLQIGGFLRRQFEKTVQF